ncbi:MAG: 2-oxo acid dehydrogenase subunit E2, partial [Hyphomicrobiales bacterium]|nr:2-oxo acid dehydrogenase subunit E2 [Hyphomicrobiales bacterium]
AQTPASIASPPPRAVPSAPQIGAPRPPGERPFASPAVRARARETGVDLRFVRGSGPAGRITRDDLEAFIARPPEAPAKRTGKEPIMAVETIKVVGLRRRIAQNMAESSRRVAHFSYVEEVDVTALEDLRASLNARATEERPKLTMLPFLMLAIVKAVADFPQVNAHYDDDGDVITRFGAVHLGVATQTPVGLMVPVVRHAEALSLHECAREMRRVSEAARQGVAAREELSGSTITLTSLGALGGVASTPVVNRPEVAIVGVNKIVVRPVWRDGGFVPRKTMNLSSSFDHRVVDGFDAATFIQRVRTLIETPASLFIEANSF